MPAWRSVRAILLAGSGLAASTPLIAQPPAAATSANAAKRVYSPADFARFAPKTAYDMLGAGAELHYSQR